MKSYVSMEQKLCIVCGKKFDTNSLLLDRRLKESMEMHTVTGFGMCEEHQKLADAGFVALVGADPEKSFTPYGNTCKPEDAHRTGRVCHLKKRAFIGIFGQEPPAGMLVFCDDEVITKLEQMQKDGAE